MTSLSKIKLNGVKVAGVTLEDLAFYEVIWLASGVRKCVLTCNHRVYLVTSYFSAFCARQSCILASSYFKPKSLEV